MSKKSENEHKNINQKKEKLSEKKGESRDVSRKKQSSSPPIENPSAFLHGASGKINLSLLEERRKTLSEEHEKLLASNRILQEEVLRLKSKIDKLKFGSQVVESNGQLMEELKSKVKHFIPEDKHFEIDKIFHEWIVGLKECTIPDGEKTGEEEDVRKKKSGRELPGKIQLKADIEGLKKRIESFKGKMKLYKESYAPTSGLALADVREEIRKVREEITKLRLKFSQAEGGRKNSKNSELLQKLDEVKQFLEKLK